MGFFVFKNYGSQQRLLKGMLRYKYIRSSALLIKQYKYLLIW